MNMLDLLPGADISFLPVLFESLRDLFYGELQKQILALPLVSC
jgi:hypothetical protein